jgi:hypothetical protein
MGLALRAHWCDDFGFQREDPNHGQIDKAGAQTPTEANAQAETQPQG